MKDLLLILLASFKLITMIIGSIFERDTEKKEKKKKAINMVKDGIKNRDPSQITAGFDRVNRV